MISISSGQWGALMSEMNSNENQTRIQQPSSPPKAVPARYQASVVIIKGHAAGMEYPVEKTSAVIGRDREADIPLKDPLVSRQHAAIVYREGAFLLKDLGSTNGTSMNGASIKEAGLRHGDTFRVGDTVLQFILEDSGRSRTYEIG